MSRRARRMAQHHRRHKRTAGLNMVSLMDIFTILVFFLLVNASDAELITPPKNVELPDSISQTRPAEALTLVVSQTDIVLNGQTIYRQGAQRPQASGSIKTLVAALEPLAEGSPSGQSTINLLADKSLEYHFIKRVLESCSEAGFETLALAVIQTSDTLP